MFHLHRSGLMDFLCRLEHFLLMAGAVFFFLLKILFVPISQMSAEMAVRIYLTIVLCIWPLYTVRAVNPGKFADSFYRSSRWLSASNATLGSIIPLFDQLHRREIALHGLRISNPRRCIFHRVHLNFAQLKEPTP